MEEKLNANKQTNYWKEPIEEVELLVIREFLRQEKTQALSEIIETGIEMKLFLGNDEGPGFPLYVDKIVFLGLPQTESELLEIWSERGGKDYVSGSVMHLLVHPLNESLALYKEVVIRLDFQNIYCLLQNEKMTLGHALDFLKNESLLKTEKEKIDFLANKMLSWHKTGKKENIIAFAEERIQLVFEKKVFASQEEMAMIALSVKTEKGEYRIASQEKLMIGVRALQN